MAKYETHSQISATVPDELKDKINNIVSGIDIGKSEFITHLLEKGLGLSSSYECKECAKRKNEFPEMVLIKIRLAAIEEKLDKFNF